MQLDLPRQTVDAIVRKLAKHGLNVNDDALVVRRLLDEMAASPDGATMAELLDRLRDERELEQPQENALELAERLGLIGCFEGPSDLSTNPIHMEGFGQ